MAAKGTATVTSIPQPAASPVLDITKMTAAQIAEYLEQRKAEEARIAKEQAETIWKEIELFVSTKGTTFDAVLDRMGYGPKMERTFVTRWFKNPANGEVKSYTNGKLADWLKNEQGKLNLSLQCNEDGTPLTA